MTDESVWVPSPYADLATELGPVRATFCADSDGRPYVSCHVQAHINDDAPAMIYRGQEYIGSVVLIDTGGIWTRDGSAYWSKRPQWTDAPPTHASALTQACAEAVREWEREHPEYVKAGQYASAQQRLGTVRGELRKLDGERKALKAQVRKLDAVPMVWAGDNA